MDKFIVLFGKFPSGAVEIVVDAIDGDAIFSESLLLKIKFSESELSNKALRSGIPEMVRDNKFVETHFAESKFNYCTPSFSHESLPLISRR